MRIMSVCALTSAAHSIVAYYREGEGRGAGEDNESVCTDVRSTFNSHRLQGGQGRGAGKELQGRLAVVGIDFYFNSYFVYKYASYCF